MTLLEHQNVANRCISQLGEKFSLNIFLAMVFDHIKESLDRFLCLYDHLHPFKVL